VNNLAEIYWRLPLSRWQSEHRNTCRRWCVCRELRWRFRAGSAGWGYIGQLPELRTLYWGGGDHRIHQIARCGVRQQDRPSNSAIQTKAPKAAAAAAAAAHVMKLAARLLYTPHLPRHSCSPAGVLTGHERGHAEQCASALHVGPAFGRYAGLSEDFMRRRQTHGPNWGVGGWVVPPPMTGGMLAQSTPPLGCPSAFLSAPAGALLLRAVPNSALAGGRAPAGVRRPAAAPAGRGGGQGSIQLHATRCFRSASSCN